MNFIAKLRFLLLALLLASVPSCAKKPADLSNIDATFQAYRTALLARDGYAAWDLLDSHTQNFYSTVQQDALTMPQAELNRLDMVHKLTVLRLRADLRRGELQNMTGQDVLVMAIANGWISKASVEALTNLHKVEIKGLYASASTAEAPKIPTLFFIKEGSDWKIALTKTFGFANATMKQWHKESRLSEKDFFMHMLGQVSKFEVDPRIWEGPLD